MVPAFSVQQARDPVAYGRDFRWIAAWNLALPNLRYRPTSRFKGPPVLLVSYDVSCQLRFPIIMMGPRSRQVAGQTNGSGCLALQTLLVVVSRSEAEIKTATTGRRTLLRQSRTPLWPPPA